MESLVNLIFKLKASCVANEANIMTEAGLSPAEYNGIAAMEPNEMVCGNTLSQKMNLSPSRASRVVEKMVQNGYLMRETDPVDRRKCNITLAEKGVKVKQEIENLKSACEKNIRKHLSKDEVNIISNSLKKIIAAL